MMSGFKLSDRRSIGISNNDGAQILQFRSKPHQTKLAHAAKSHDISPRVTFNSLTLDELSKELDRRTKETQRLQDEVENATKLTLERFGCTYGIRSSPGLGSHNQRFNDYCSPGDSTFHSIHLNATTQPLVGGLESLNQEVAQMDISSLEDELLENAIDDSLQQQFGLDITETKDQPKPATFSFDIAIKNLQTELHKVRIEKDIVSDLRIQDLIASLGQEMAQLADNLSSSKSNSVSLSVKLQMLNKLAEKETKLHSCQVSELISALSRHKDKVNSLEQELTHAQLQIIDAQRETEKSLQKEETLRSMLGRHKSCCEQQQCEVQEEIKALRGRLKVVEEQLHRAGEEKTCVQVLLEQRTLEGRKYQELLVEKTNESRLRHQQHLASLEEAERWSHTLQADGETLRLKLVDHEKMVDMLSSQMENRTKMTLQHSHTIDKLHQENSLLSNQLIHLKMENQQLRADLEQQKSDLAIMAQESRWLQASLTEQSQRVEAEILEKQQVTSQLEFQRMELLNLKTKHQQLQQLLSFKSGAHKGVVLNLQGQLKNTHDELDQVRRTLRTLERADGHGLQAAVDMQEQITARREDMDSLQSRIQHLEETIEKLHKEKLYQSLEYQGQLQELAVIKEEKRHLGSELEAHLSKDKQLRDRISQLVAILHKMSESFADCQDFLQLQDQNFIRLKIQHALDLKELQGQTMHTAPRSNYAHSRPPPHLAPMSQSALNAPPSSQHASNTQITPNNKGESPAHQLKSLVKELRAAISENQRPHMDSNATASSYHRRRSAPERMQKIILSPDQAEEVKGDTRLRQKIHTSPFADLKKVGLNEKITNKSLSESPDKWSSAFALRYTSSPHLLSLGHRSPVHSLLTGNPDSKQ